MERSIEIRASPEKVWEMLFLDKLTEWVPGYQRDLKSVEYTSELLTSEDKLKVGASAHGIPKKKGEFNFEITESLKNQRMAYRLSGSLNVLVTNILEPIGEGTKFTYVYEYEMPWGIFGKIAEKLLIGELKKESEISLKILKSILEK
ncbi:MAG: SRPBCC family protein [Candidatus Methylarchaceae archaeon HK02M2]|nr:SRPBCC family protein [Candidatus Methylarchaceae archaeon HK02M2]